MRSRFDSSRFDSSLVGLQRALRFVLLAMALLALAACSDDPTGSAGDIVNVQVSAAAPTVEKGDSVLLSAAPKRADGTTRTDVSISWFSTDTSIARGIDAAVTGGARVINMSLGGSAPDTTLLSAMSRAVNSGVVLVISAGNDGDKPEGVDADPFAAIPAGKYPKNVIVAGSVGYQGSGVDQLSSFSNKAGVAADNYLAALGSGVRTIGKDGQYSSAASIT